MMKFPRLTSESGIYIIICMANLRGYIGSSYQMTKRWTCHRRDLRGNKHINCHLQHAWDKYGEDQFMVGVLEYTPKEQLFEREQVYLDRFKPFGEAGFNILPRADGRRGCTLSEETKRKIGLAHLGSKRTPESIAKMHVWRKNDPDRAKEQDDKKRISFRIMSPQGEIFAAKGIKLFCREHDLSPGQLKFVIFGKIRQHKGWHLPETVLSSQTLIDPTGTKHVIVERELKGFCRKHQLGYTSIINKLLKGIIDEYKGWRIP